MERDIYIENKPLEEAAGLFLDALAQCGFFRLDSISVPVNESLGRITSQPVMARRSSPHYVAAAMDGIATVAEATYGAAETSPVLLKPGDYMEVDTGDYVPRQYNTVIMIEDVNMIGEGAEVIKPAVPWQHIRSVGEDLVAGDMLLTSGCKIGAYELASMITAAVEQVEVVKKPRVAIIPTGTELVDTGSMEMPPGAIVESNSHMLASLCLEWGAEPVRYPIVIDDPGLLEAAVARAGAEADMIVVCSGSSAGREDYTSNIINKMGQLLVHGIAIRPGKPAILGIIKDKPVIGVPGYPISAQLIFHLMARPVLYRKQGLQPPTAEELPCRINRKTASSMGVDEFVYVNLARIKDSYVAFPLSRGAGITTSLVKADGVLHIKRGTEGLKAGASCRVQLKRDRHLIDQSLVTIGSHDMSIDVLADLMQLKENLRVISTNAGSMGGIMALKRAETHFAGIHLLDLQNGEYNLSYLLNYLPNQHWRLVNLVKRQQGLMVVKSNPLGISVLHDLTRKEVRFINRQKGSGTRILLDYLLSREQISPGQINGYNREEYTHLAVAAAVKNDACDCGLGIYASARAMDVDFIPLSEERYDICILEDLLPPGCLDKLLAVINSADFKERLESLGGYNTELTGECLYVNHS